MTTQTKVPCVLVVDDNEDFRASLKILLEAGGLQVKTAPDAKSAQHLVSIADVDLVLSDIRMPGMSGIELLHCIKRLKPLPVVLMTGFSELVETKEASELGADGFLAKPFQRDELMRVIRGCLKLEAPKDDRDLDEDFARLHIDDFVSGSQIQYDIYIRVSSSKYVKVAHTGEDIPIERIKAYKHKNVRHLYIRRDDFRKYIGLNLTLVKAAQGSPRISREKKAALIKHAGEVLLENFSANGVDEEAFAYVKTFTESAMSAFTDDNDLYALFEALQKLGDDAYAHSVGVAAVATMIARKLGWAGGATYSKIALGGLMHDIGNKELPPEILERKRHELSHAEVKQLESHPTRGMELLAEIRSIPGDVLQIVAQHHEDCIGSGFPLGLTRDRIHPLARLIAVAEEFCELTIKKGDRPALSPHDAIARLLALKADRLEPQYFIALMKLYQFNPPVEFSDAQRWMSSQRSTIRERKAS